MAFSERNGRSYEDMVEEHDKTLYHYDGLTSRMQIAEVDLKTLKKYNEDAANRRETKANITLTAALAAVAMLIVDLIMKIR